MRISENAVKMLAAKMYRGIGRKWINDNLRGGMSPEAIVSRLGEKTEDVTLRDYLDKCAWVQGKIGALGDAIDGVVGIGDPEFPAIPKKVKAADRPIALFYKGNLSLLSKVSDNVALIGLLNPTEAIEDAEKEVALVLGKMGKCVVSGLALGCDTVGHRTAVEYGFPTVAFLASALNEINPPSNRPLAEEIVSKGGLLVSEYFDKAHSRNEFLGRYPERDRLQAMFASAVVLAASYAPNNFGGDCGSRFALDKAKEYGVTRAALSEGAADDRMFDLNRAVLADGGIAIKASNTDTLLQLDAAAGRADQMQFAL